MTSTGDRELLPTYSVVIPTKNRPGKLAGALEALHEAQQVDPFTVHVCDSSTSDVEREQVRSVCARFEFVQLHFHDGDNLAKARNFATAMADTDLIVSVDDDVQVEPESVLRLVDALRARDEPAVVGGHVRWGERWVGPVTMRPIGFGRATEAGEDPDFLVGAFFAYPAWVGTAMPWNELLRSSDDRFIGALWRACGVRLCWEPDARAHHHDEHNSYGVEHMRSHIYANLFDAVLARRSLWWALSFSVIGLAAGAKHFRRPSVVPALLAAWFRGILHFAADVRRLRAMVRVGAAACRARTGTGRRE